VTEPATEEAPRPAERIARGPESPEGYYHDSFDYPALRAVLLDPLGPGGNLKFRRRVFDYRTDSPMPAPIETTDQESILLFDGVFLQRPELADLWDVTIFVSVPSEETQRRAADRDRFLFGSAEATLHRYATRYVPGQQIYFEEAHPEASADVVFYNEDPDRPRVRRRAPLDR
jgi:uridine kinase